MITAQGITFERYFEPVFHPVDIDVPAGVALLVTGANGSGKTTLIRLLAGLLHPSRGKISRTTEQRAFVGHQLGIKDDLTVEENLRFMAAFHGDATGDIGAAVRRLGLDTVRFKQARNLSAGQRKRCALARVLLSVAPLWLLDEPYSNLDREGMGVMDTMLSEHLDGGGACILSTHGALRPEGLQPLELELRRPDSAT